MRILVGYTMPIYLNYDNGAIAGDVTAAGHEKWIELDSIQWGVARALSSPTGASADRESSAPIVSVVTVGKATDVASVKLLNEAYQGEGKTVQIDFCKTDKGSLELYLSITLANTMIGNYSLSCGGDRPKESLTLCFSRIEVKNVGMGAAGETGSPDSVAYDLAQAHVV